MRQGTFSKDQHIEQVAPGVYLDDINAPDFLSDGAKGIFLDLTKTLNCWEILSLTDLGGIAILSEYMAQFSEITELLNQRTSEERYKTEGSRKQDVLEPLLKQQKIAAEMVLKISKQYAMTPVVRAKMKMKLPGGTQEDQTNQWSCI